MSWLDQISTWSELRRERLARITPEEFARYEVAYEKARRELEEEIAGEREEDAAGDQTPAGGGEPGAPPQ